MLCAAEPWTTTEKDYVETTKKDDEESPPTMWGTIMGPCTVDGACVLSPNFPHDYGPNETCTISIYMEHAAAISVESFDTEFYFDTLIVNGDDYSGTEGPEGVAPTESIFWSSDYSIEAWARPKRTFS